MPGTSDEGTILPEALKAARQRRNMTQQELAEVIGCAKDTVSRWERGTTGSVRFRLREPLREALGVRKWEHLTKPPKQVTNAPEDKDVPGHVWIKFLAGKDMHTALHLVAERYNVRPGDVLKLAPLFFLIVAERSLQERWIRLQEIEVILNEATEHVMSNAAHLGGIVAARSANSEERLIEEVNSIEIRDIFGRTISYEGFDEERESPFLQFVRDFSKDLPKDALVSIESFDGETIHSYQIADDTLRECTGISEEEESGEDLLHYIRMGAINLAESMRAKRDMDEAGYRQWLLEALEQAKQHANDLLAQL